MAANLSDQMSAQYRMADRLAGGHLRQVMADLRATGRSFAFVARELYANHGVEVTGETVRSWCNDLGIEKGPDISNTAGAA